MNVKTAFFALISPLLFSAPIYAQPTQVLDTPDAHLAFRMSAVHAHAYWEVPPQLGRPSVLRVEFRSAGRHQPIDVKQKVSVDLWMPSMGHGSAPTVIEQVLGSEGVARVGVYRISNMYFVMEGLWDVRVMLTEEDGSDEMQTFPVEISVN